MLWAANAVLFYALCIFRLLRVSNLCEHQTKAVFDLKLMVRGVKHKSVLDKRRFRAYYDREGWRLNFLFASAYNLRVSISDHLRLYG